MKTHFLFSLALAAYLVGCGEKSGKADASATNATGGSIVSAPTDYLKAAAKAQQDSVKTVDTASLDKAISMFNVDKGRYPKDLNELVQEKYIPKIPPTPFGTKLSYDPNTGGIGVVKE